MRDTGVGIAESDQSRLFDVFSQVDGSATRAYEGTGIGLALVAGLAKEMNGLYGVDSEVNQGSVFWVKFPRTQPLSEAVTADFHPKEWLAADSDFVGEGDDRTSLGSHIHPSREDSDGGSESPLILVVDDLVDMRNLITGVLGRKGYRTQEAVHGKAGLRMAQELLPDLIITDWMMPQMHGPELIEELKNDERCRAIPVVLLTAKSDNESAFATTAGIGFLGEAFNDLELLSVVSNYWNSKSVKKN